MASFTGTRLREMPMISIDRGTVAPPRVWTVSATSWGRDLPQEKDDAHQSGNEGGGKHLPEPHPPLPCPARDRLTPREKSKAG